MLPRCSLRHQRVPHCRRWRKTSRNRRVRRTGRRRVVERAWRGRRGVGCRRTGTGRRVNVENGEVENRESEDSSSMRSTERKVSQREPLSEGQLPSLAVWLSCMVRRTESLEKKNCQKNNGGRLARRLALRCGPPGLLFQPK